MAAVTNIVFLLIFLQCFACIPCEESDEMWRTHEFVFSIPVGSVPDPPVVYITTSSTRNLRTTLDYPSTGYGVSNTVSRSSPAIIELYGGTVGISDIRIGPHEGSQNKTIIIRSEGTVSVHAIDNNSQNGDGFVVYSNSQLGTEYYVASCTTWNIYTSFVCVSSIQPNTLVNIKTKAGKTRNITLRENESFRFDGEKGEDLSGTLVRSDKPTAVISGAVAMIGGNVDGILEQLTPTNQWKSIFILTPFLSLNSGFIYRIYSMNVETTISTSDNITLQLQPESFYERNVVEDKIVTISADHPVMAVQYMRGGFSYDPPRGDISMVVIPPVTSLTPGVVTFPVFEYLHHGHEYFINVVTDCDNVDGLFLDNKINIRHWDRLTTEDQETCCVRGDVTPGQHTVSHTDLTASYYILVYGISTSFYSSYAYTASTYYYVEALFRWDTPDNIYSVSESDGVINIPLSREGTVQSKTVEIVAQDLTATDLVDYQLISTNVTFPAGVSTVTVPVRLIDDDDVEGVELFTLTLRDPLYQEGNRGISYTLIVEISDDDIKTTPAPPPPEPEITIARGFVGSNVVIQCSITGVVPYNNFDEFNKIEVYKQFGNGTLDTAVKIAERLEGDKTTTIFDVDGVDIEEEKLTFVLIPSRFPGGAFEISNVNYNDGGFYWCVFKGPTHLDLSRFDQSFLEVVPCAGVNSSLATNNSCIDLVQLDQVKVSDANVAEVASVLVETLENTDMRVLTDEEVQHVANVLNDIVQIGNGSEQITNSVIQAVSNVLNAGESPVPPANKTHASASRITLSVEKQVSLALQQNDQVHVVEFNVAVQGISLDQSTMGGSDITGIGFGLLSDSAEEFTNNSTRTFYEEGDIKNAQPSAFIFVSQKTVSSLSSSDDLEFIFVAYRNDFLFPSRKVAEDSWDVEGIILSATVNGENVDTSNLLDPVVIENDIEIPEAEAPEDQSRDHCNHPSSEPMCVSWDFNLEGGAGDWSDEGCRHGGVNEKGRTVCKCDHLTNFAVLVYHGNGKKPILSEALDILSRIGCGLSIAALAITVAIFAVFRRLRKTARNILINLCLSLIGLYLVFLVAIDRTCPQVACIFSAALLHYFTLTTMAWMAVEARYIYIKLVRVFDPESSRFVLMSGLAAWGIPVVIVGISVGAGFKYYKNEHYCFPSLGPVIYFALLLPISIVIVHNVISFALVLRSIFRRRPGERARSSDDRKQTISRFRNSVAVACLLGLTWVFGFLAIDEAAVAFQVLFCVFNSLQGVFIFIFFTVGQADVRNTITSTFSGGANSSHSSRQGNSSSATGGHQKPRGQPKSQTKLPPDDMFLCTPPGAHTLPRVDMGVDMAAELVDDRGTTTSFGADHNTGESLG